MVREIIQVKGMTCEHCVLSITKVLMSLEGMEKVDINLKTKDVNVEYDEKKLSNGKIKNTIENQGYDID